MKKNMYLRTTILLCCLLFMVLDSRNVISGAKEGLQICLQVIIPSLFPFLILSNILTAAIGGKQSIFTTGILGGYPSGAQAVKTAYDLKLLSREHAEDLLTYCNQAGPAFIFGMLSQLFTNGYIPWIIWAIHILSALIIRSIFHRQQKDTSPSVNASKKCTISDSLERSVKTISLVCGWVILFRVIMQVLNVRLFRQQTNLVTIIISGLLELSNGCIMLNNLGSVKLRFILCSAFLGFGGICVTFQTISIAKGLNIKRYLAAKVLQGLISAVLAGIFSFLLPY